MHHCGVAASCTCIMHHNFYHINLHKVAASFCIILPASFYKLHHLHTAYHMTKWAIVVGCGIVCIIDCGSTYHNRVICRFQTPPKGDFSLPGWPSAPAVHAKVSFSLPPWILWIFSLPQKFHRFAAKRNYKSLFLKLFMAPHGAPLFFTPFATLS